MDNLPELEGWENIDNSGGTIGTGINQAIHKLVIAIAHSGLKTSSWIENLQKEIGKLNKHLEKASESSDRHARALTHATWTLAGATIVLAVATLILVFKK